MANERLSPEAAGALLMGALDDLRESCALLAEALGIHRMVGGAQTWESLRGAINRAGEKIDALKEDLTHAA